jgi:hypothetical protein
MTSATAPDDYEVRRAVWDSRVPVEFVLDPGDQLSLLHRGAGLQQSTFVRYSYSIFYYTYFVVLDKFEVSKNLKKNRLYFLLFLS